MMVFHNFYFMISTLLKTSNRRLLDSLRLHNPKYTNNNSFMFSDSGFDPAVPLLYLSVIENIMAPPKLEDLKEKSFSQLLI